MRIVSLEVLVECHLCKKQFPEAETIQIDHMLLETVHEGDPWYLVAGHEEEIDLGGTLTKTGKMPKASWSIPAGLTCPIGSKLANVPDSICKGCYAKGGMYRTGTVKRAQMSRYNAICDALKTPEGTERWIQAMVKAIRKSESTHFRIHDSGDFFSDEYFLAWTEVANRMPEVEFWAPTKEIGMIKRNEEFIPGNLHIRISSFKYDKPAPKIKGYPTASVHSKEPPIGFECPAPDQEGKCEDCRACWDPNVSNVSYKKH